MEEEKQVPGIETSGSAERKDRPPLQQIGPALLPVNEIVNRLEELVRFVLECETTPMQRDVSFVDIYKQLLKIREAITVLSADQQDMLSMLETAGVSRQQMSKALSQDEKKMISKLQNLQGICEAAKERLHKSIKKHPEVEKEIQEKIRAETTTKKQKVVHRKGKFKRMGGKEGWLPT